MGASLFNKKLKKSCAWCEYGKLSEFNGEVICIKHGVTDKMDSCRKYKYDPLKRVPERAVPSGKFSKKDFEL